MLEEAIPTEEPQETKEEVPQPVGEKKEKPWLKPLLFSILGIIVTVGLVFAGYKFAQNRQVRLVSLPTPTPELVVSPTPEEKASLTKDKIFFIEEKNIFVVDKQGKDKTQITNFPSTDFGYPQSLQVIDDEYLGFYKCDTKTGDFDCGIYRVSVNSRQPEKIIKEEADKLILQLAWYDQNTFAYTVSGKSAENWWIYFYKNGNKEVIQEIKGEPYGRGGFIEDSSKLSFSPDGTKLLHIATSSPRSGEDFNIYIFDRNELTKIENSTQPAWLDNKTVIFRRRGEGLYTFDPSTKTEKKYENVNSKAYAPKLLKGTPKVVYWVNEGNGQVWLLDTASGKTEMLLENASDPLWISGEEILVSENKDCLECMGRTFTTALVSVFNLETKSKTKLFEANEGMGGGNIFYDVTYYNSHWSD